LDSVQDIEYMFLFGHENIYVAAEFSSFPVGKFILVSKRVVADDDLKIYIERAEENHIRAVNL